MKSNHLGFSCTWVHADNQRMALCVICSASLSGRQRKFCSRECKNRHGNNRYQSYFSQQARGRSRKLALVKLKGGRCRHCGYDRNYAALEFHHARPVEKRFNLDLRSLSNRGWSSILGEVNQCELVCSNCHKEIHNPHCRLPR
jgi:hypothetical protein